MRVDVADATISAERLSDHVSYVTLNGAGRHGLGLEVAGIDNLLEAHPHARKPDASRGSPNRPGLAPSSGGSFRRRRRTGGWVAAPPFRVSPALRGRGWGARRHPRVSGWVSGCGSRLAWRSPLVSGGGCEPRPRHLLPGTPTAAAQVRGRSPGAGAGVGRGDTRTRDRQPRTGRALGAAVSAETCSGAGAVREPRTPN